MRRVVANQLGEAAALLPRRQKEAGGVARIIEAGDEEEAVAVAAVVMGEVLEGKGADPRAARFVGATFIKCICVVGYGPGVWCCTLPSSSPLA